MSNFFTVGGAIAGGATEGLVTRRQMDRQAMMDKLKMDDLAFRRAAAEASQKLERDKLGATMAENESQAGLRTAQANKANTDATNSVAEERRKVVDRLLGPLTFKDKEVADRTAPYRSEFEGYVTSPVGAASVDAGDPVLMGEHKRLTDEASKTAEGIYKRRDELSEEKLKTQKERTSALQTWRTRLSDPQAERIVDLDNSLGDAADVKGMLGNVDPNMYAMRVNDWLSRYGAGAGVDQNFILFRARTARELANYVKSISGQAVAEPEFKRLERVVVNPDDSLGAAITKVQEFERFLLRKRSNALRVYSAQGKTWNPALNTPPNVGNDENVPGYARPAED